ncbi:MAG: DnaA/Hda family protein [Phycisphaeraceae bacterium]
MAPPVQPRRKVWLGGRFRPTIRVTQPVHTGVRHVNTATDSDIVARVSDRLAAALGPRPYAMWFEQSAQFVVDEPERALRVHVPSRFIADRITRHYEPALRDAAEQELGEAASVEVRVDADRFARSAGSTEAAHAPPRSAAVGPVAPRRRPSRLRHCLDSFVVGPSNELAYAAAARLADEDAEAGHPVFLHGGCGLGKTHLLQGVCRRLLERMPDARVHYTTGEQFTNDYITAVRANRLDQFRKRTRQLDLLAVDDIHFIANKQATQQEFLHSFDQIELGGARVVLASDSHPKLIEQFSEALISRCVRGLVVRIAPPDAPTRRRLVDALAQRRGLVLHESAAQALAQRCAGSVREIEGTLTKLQALMTLARHSGQRAGEPIGHAMIDHLLASDAAMPAPQPLAFEHVVEAVTERLGVTRQQVMGRSRHKLVVLARSVTIYLARALTPLSYPEIARAMGRKNHSTVITACQRVQRQLGQADPAPLPPTLNTATLSDLLDELTRALRCSGAGRGGRTVNG